MQRYLLFLDQNHNAVIEESFEARGKRRKLIDELRRKGIDDEKVLEAMGRPGVLRLLITKAAI